jgi:hypothetical protein
MCQTLTNSQLRFRCSTVENLPPSASIIIHGTNRKSERLKARIESSRPDIRIVGFLNADSENPSPTGEVEPQFDRAMLRHCDGVINHTNWIQSAWKLIDAGCISVHVLPIFDPSDCYRNCIVVDSKRVIFVPIYKSAYSSFTEFFRAAFPENFADRKEGSLNSFVDLRNPEYQSYFKFSVVRDPLARASSCFMDKYARSDGHHNVELWRKPLLTLIERESLTFSEWLELICSIPDTHSDPHWRSQYTTLHDSSGALVDEVFHLEKLSTSLAEISQRLSMPVVLQRLNATRAVPECNAEVREMVKARYRDDYAVFGY